MRRIITRSLAVIPAMTISISVGKPGINTLLVASQVVLSVVLPFVSVPLLYCTSSKAIMSVRKKRAEMIDSRPVTPNTIDVPSKEIQYEDRDPSTAEKAEVEEGEMVEYSNNTFVTATGVILWLIIVAANVYVITELGLGGQT